MPFTTPVLTRPWYNQVDVPAQNYASVKGATDSFLWQLKEALKGTLTGGTTGNANTTPGGAPITPGTRAPASLWTVVGSCDGVTASFTDGVDRWGSTYTPSLLVNAANGTAHSWMILRNTTLGVWLVIDYNSITAGNCYLQWSTVAPVNGTVTAGPRFVVLANETPFGQNNSNATASFALCGDSIFGPAKFHFSVDQFGGFYAALSRNGAGICSTLVFLARFADTRPGDQAPIIAFAFNSSSGRGAPTNMGSVFAPFYLGVRQASNSTRVTVAGPAIYQFGGSVFPVALNIDVLEGKYAAWDIPVESNDVGQTCYRGLIPDAWYCANNPVGSGQANTTTIVGDLHLPFFLRPTF